MVRPHKLMVRPQRLAFETNWTVCGQMATYPHLWQFKTEHHIWINNSLSLFPERGIVLEWLYLFSRSKIIHVSVSVAWKYLSRVTKKLDFFNIDIGVPEYQPVT